MKSQHRRSFLKSMTGAGVGLSLTMAGVSRADGTGSAVGEASGLPSLVVEVLTGHSTAVCTVVLRNLTAETILVDNFKPGIVAFKDCILDLNQFCRKGQAVIAAGQLLTLTVAKWQLLAQPMLNEDYLRVDGLVFPLHEDARQIQFQLNAVVVDRQAELALKLPELNPVNSVLGIFV